MDLVATPKNPIPLGVSVGFLKAKGNVRLRYARWPSALRERHGTVCIFPGRAEFIEKYFEVVGELQMNKPSRKSPCEHGLCADSVATSGPISPRRRSGRFRTQRCRVAANECGSLLKPLTGGRNCCFQPDCDQRVAEAPVPHLVAVSSIV